MPRSNGISESNANSPKPHRIFFHIMCMQKSLHQQKAKDWERHTSIIRMTVYVPYNAPFAESHCMIASVLVWSSSPSRLPSEVLPAQQRRYGRSAWWLWAMIFSVDPEKIGGRSCQRDGRNDFWGILCLLYVIFPIYHILNRVFWQDMFHNL